MPQSVQVRFTPENDWSFVQDPIRVKNKDVIVYDRTPSSAPWHFTGATVTPPHPQFTITVTNDKVTIDDTHAQGGDGTFCVVLTVQHDNGNIYPSPDPQIINEPSKSFSSPLYVAIGLVVGAIAGALIDVNTGAPATQSPFKGLVVGAIIGAIVGWLIASRRRP